MSHITLCNHLLEPQCINTPFSQTQSLIGIAYLSPSAVAHSITAFKYNLVAHL